MVRSRKLWLDVTASSKKQGTADLPAYGKPTCHSKIRPLLQSNVHTTTMSVTSWATLTKTTPVSKREASNDSGVTSNLLARIVLASQHSTPTLAPYKPTKTKLIPWITCFMTPSPLRTWTLYLTWTTHLPPECATSHSPSLVSVNYSRTYSHTKLPAQMPSHPGYCVSWLLSSLDQSVLYFNNFMTQEPSRKPRGTPWYPQCTRGSKHDPGNYRPVSLTSIICKIEEHIIVSSMLLSPRGAQDTEPWPAWVPQTSFYWDPTHTSRTRLGEHHQRQRPNWCLILRLQQGLWHAAPQTPDDEVEKLWYRWQDERLDCCITTWPPTESDDQWNWIQLVPCPLGCPTGNSDRPDIVSPLHQWYRHRHQLTDETFHWW